MRHFMQGSSKTIQINAQSPFSFSQNSIFYLDFEDREFISKITALLSSIGLRVTSFFSIDVTHMVTNRFSSEDLKNIRNEAKKLQSQTNFDTFIIPSPMASPISPSLIKSGREGLLTPISILSPTELTSLSLALSGGNSEKKRFIELIKKALDMNITIWSINQLFSILRSFGLKLPSNKYKQNVEFLQALKESSVKPASEKKKDTFQNQYLTTSPLTIKSKISNLRRGTIETFKLFEFPFIMIEDSLRNYKPIFKEYPSMLSGTSKINTYPMLYLAATFGFCPFLRQSVRKSSKSLNATGSTQPAIQSPSIQKSKYERVKKAGFCECCLEKYIDMDMHIQEPFHRKFAKTAKNYSALDQLIATTFQRIPLNLLLSNTKEQTLKITNESSNPSTLNSNPKNSNKIPRSVRKTLYPADYDLSYSSLRSLSSSSFSELDTTENDLLKPNIFNQSILTPSSPIAKRFNNSTFITLKLSNMNTTNTACNSLKPAKPSQLTKVISTIDDVTPEFISKLGKNDVVDKENINPNLSADGIPRVRFVCHNKVRQQMGNQSQEHISIYSSDSNTSHFEKVPDSSPSSPIKLSDKKISYLVPSSPLSTLTKKAIKHAIQGPDQRKHYRAGKRDLRASTLTNSVESKYRKIDSVHLDKTSFHEDTSAFKKGQKSKKILIFPF